jgi:hypothetical protein
MDFFAALSFASALCLVVALFIPSMTAGVDGNAGTWSQLPTSPSRDLDLVPIKTAGRPPAVGNYSGKRKVAVVSN